MFFRKLKDNVLKNRIAQLENQLEQKRIIIENKNEFIGTLIIENNNLNAKIQELQNTRKIRQARKIEVNDDQIN